ATGFGGWIATLPPAAPVRAPPPVPAAEAAAMRDALRPPKRARPLVAIVAINDGTEVTDYLMPYGILRRADVADVVALATRDGPVDLYPALRVRAEATLAEFDARHPDGADYVVVPAMRRDDDPTVLAWLKAQAAGGAIIVAVCAGAKVVAAAGLLDGRRATTHWWYVDPLRREDPSIRYVPDRRMVVERGVATTTGISASMPMALTLVEAIAGRDRASAVARDLGIVEWDARHDSSAFRLTRPFALTALANTLAFWRHEELALPIAPGVDEVSLALVADAWSRTYRSEVLTFAVDAGPIESRNGLAILPDRVAERRPDQLLLSPVAGHSPAEALDQALRAIALRHGPATRDLVAMQLELTEQPSAP
ncbi:MAG: DJ-1/PfpI family protein, partial [Alphaproteobacteria bacterium]